MKKFLFLFILSLAIFTAQAQTPSATKKTKSQTKTVVKLTPTQTLRVSASTWEKQSSDDGLQRIVFSDKGIAVLVINDDSLIIYDQFGVYSGKEKSAIIDTLNKVDIVQYLKLKYEHTRLVEQIQSEDLTWENPLFDYVDFTLIPNKELEELIEVLSKKPDTKDLNLKPSQSSPVPSTMVNKKKYYTFWQKVRHPFCAECRWYYIKVEKLTK